jgi:hypothetical protein
MHGMWLDSERIVGDSENVRSLSTEGNFEAAMAMRSKPHNRGNVGEIFRYENTLLFVRVLYHGLTRG